MTTYKNSFYDRLKKNPLVVPFLTTNAKPVEYKGHLIYHRIVAITKDVNVFDIVKGDVCIGMCAGLNGAKKRIDELVYN